MPRASPVTAGRITALDLYELCVTEPVRVVRFLGAAHAGGARLLREDFSGSGALARAWARMVPRAAAIAVDRDASVLARAAAPGVRTLATDATRCRVKADIIAATNFPICYLHTRRALIQYLNVVRASLRARGVFVCDLYGGADAFSIGKQVQMLRAPTAGPFRGELIEYTFEQRSADPVSGRVTDALHFRLWRRRTKPGRPHLAFQDAFVYDWRLWSIPELSDAMREAGFVTVEIYDRLGDAIDSEGTLHLRPVRPGEDLDRNWVVYIVARVK